MSPLARRITHAVLFLAAAIGVSAVPASAAAPAQKLNVVFFLADDLGWADTGCYGGDLHETPNIDRLARQGVRFTDAYAASPVCSPDAGLDHDRQVAGPAAHDHLAGGGPAIRRGTGSSCPRSRVANLPHTEVTIARVLHDAGYLTALVGKWHLGDAAHYPETHGFDINIGGTIWGVPATYFYPYRGREAGGEIRYVPHLEWGKTGEYLTDRLTDEALKIIDRAGDRPFFLYLAHHAVHIPMEAKQADGRALPPQAGSPSAPPERDLCRHDAEPGRERRPRLGEAPASAASPTAPSSSSPPTTAATSAKTAARSVPDDGPPGLADNGGYVGNDGDKSVTDNYPLRSGKGSLYEGGVRVPLIVRWPGVTPAGGVCREPVVSTDFYPTCWKSSA